MSKMVKLKIRPGAGGGGLGGAASPAQDGVPHSATSAPSPAPSVAEGAPARPKLKIKASQPPTPATEQPPSATSPAPSASGQRLSLKASKKPSIKLGNNKRPAGDELASAPKRIASEGQAARKPSLQIKVKPKPPPVEQQNPYGIRPGQTPLSAASKLKIGGPKRKQSTALIKSITTHNVRRDVPVRETGVGYDSEDSEREEDPAIQQGLILRMQPGKDADLLRKAITEGTIGDRQHKDGVDASIRFITGDLRRAVVRVQDRKYAAALVDLPCIVESMKSWDKKGWWKVADVHQMLLVLGPIQQDNEAKDAALPREVNKENWQYAHGLTPPMHYVRKRRFRKRVSHRQMENVEEEVERLIREDEAWEREHGKVEHKEYTTAEWERQQNAPGEEAYDEEMDADGELMETTEGYDAPYAETPQEYEDDPDLEAALAGAFANDMDTSEPLAPEVSDSPMPLADQGTSYAAVENTMSEAPTPIPATPQAGSETPLPGTPDQQTQDEASSDEDDEESEEELDPEEKRELELKKLEKQQQMDEVADLEREIAAGRARANAMQNQLLKKRELDKLAKLEGDLKMKRAAFGLDEDGDGDE